MALTLNYKGPFEWTTNNIGGPFISPTNPSPDMYGNLYGNGRAYDRTGAFVWNGLTDVDLIAAINAYNGSTIATLDFSANATVATPILGGTYLLTWFHTEASHVQFWYWWILLEVPPPGSFNHLVVLGFVRYRTLLGVPYTWWASTLSMNGQTAGDPILILGNVNVGAFVELFALIPSPSELISRVYAGGWGGSFGQPYEIPYAYYDLSLGGMGDRVDLFFANQTSGGNGLGVGTGAVFSLPGPGSGTNIFQYLGRSRMDYESHGGLGGFLFCPEIKNVIEPAYPLGQMIKVNIPNTSFFATMSLAVANNLSGVGMDGLLIETLGYSLDGPNWGIPWTDEWTYLSNGKVGGKDAYHPSVSYHGQLPSGEWFVAFIMPGAYDANVNFAFPTPFEAFKRLQMKAIRGFIYDPNTGTITTAFPRVTGIAYTWFNINVPVDYAARTNEIEILDPIQTGPDSYDMHIYGATNNGGVPIWRTMLHFGFGRPWMQVNW